MVFIKLLYFTLQKYHIEVTMPIVILNNDCTIKYVYL